VGLIRGIEENRQELAVVRSRVIEDLGHRRTLPADAQALAGLLVTVEAAMVGLGADDQDEIGLLDHAGRPARPALGRRGLILIQLHRDAFAAQPVAKGQHAVHVLPGIVAVADEHPRSADGVIGGGHGPCIFARE